MSVPGVSDVLKVQRSSFRCMDPSFDRLSSPIFVVVVVVAECSLSLRKREKMKPF